MLETKIHSGQPIIEELDEDVKLPVILELHRVKGQEQCVLLLIQVYCLVTVVKYFLVCIENSDCHSACCALVCVLFLTLFDSLN